MSIFNRRVDGGDARRVQELEAQVAAMDRAQEVCEFSLDGRVLRANDSLLRLLGFKAAELEETIAATIAALAKHPAAFPDVLVTSSRNGAGMPELRAAMMRLLAERGQ